MSSDKDTEHTAFENFGHVDDDLSGDFDISSIDLDEHPPEYQRQWISLCSRDFLMDPVKKLYGLVLLQASRDKASDVYFLQFPFAHNNSSGVYSFQMKYRIGDTLYEMVPPPFHVAAGMSDRIKLSCQALEEKEHPQRTFLEKMLGRKYHEPTLVPGKISLEDSFGFVEYSAERKGKEPFTFFASINSWESHGLPNYHLKLWQPDSHIPFSEYEASDEDKKTIEKLMKEENGLILLTGKPNSGKSSTAYALMNMKVTPNVNVGAVGRALVPGSVQLISLKPHSPRYIGQVNAFLDSNPDLVYFDNISDPFTARTAVERASQTLVLASVSGSIAKSVERFYALGADRKLLERNWLGGIDQQMTWPHLNAEGEPLNTPRIGVKLYRTLDA